MLVLFSKEQLVFCPILLSITETCVVMSSTLALTFKYHSSGKFLFHKIIIFFPSPRIANGVSCLLWARTGSIALTLNQFFMSSCFNKCCFWPFCVSCYVGWHTKNDWHFICITCLSLQAVMFSVLINYVTLVCY